MHRLTHSMSVLSDDFGRTAFRFKKERQYSEGDRNNISNGNIQIPFAISEGKIQKNSPISLAQSPSNIIDVIFPSLDNNNNRLPLADIEFHILFAKLNASIITVIYDALLTEQSVLFISEELSILTTCIEIMLHLIYPFTWPFVYIPILPNCLYDYLDAPQPMLVGGSRYLRHKAPSHIIIVDLDNNTIRKPKNNRKFNLNHKKKHILNNYVINIINPIYQKIVKLCYLLY